LSFEKLYFYIVKYCKKNDFYENLRNIKMRKNEFFEVFLILIDKITQITYFLYKIQKLDKIFNKNMILLFLIKIFFYKHMG